MRTGEFFKRKRTLIIVGLALAGFTIAGYIFVSLSFSGSATPAYGIEKTAVPSWGSGRYELFIFTDYFCPPCQALEGELDPALEAILMLGGVKVTFVDLPIHRPTVLYNRYYLYAAYAGADYKTILHARRSLFNLAKQQTITSEEAIAGTFKKDNVPFKPLDPRPVQVELNKIIKDYKVNSTPTCIVKYSKNDIRTYKGAKEIMDGMRALKAALRSSTR